jgi:hypothetical protein
MAGWYAILLALMALTLGLCEFVPRHEPSDRQVLGSLESDGDLATWWTAGHVRPDLGRARAVVLEVAGAIAGASVLRRAVDLRTPATMILRAEIAPSIVETGDGSGGGAWMIVGSLADSGPTSLYSEKGAYKPYLATSSHGWRSLEATFTVPAGRGDLAFEAGIGGGAGSVLRLADLVLLEASERTGFRIGRLALMAAWGPAVARGGVGVWRSLESGWARLALGSLLAVAAVGLMSPASP